MRKGYTDEQIIGFLKQAAADMPIKEVCRQHGFSDASFYLWRRRFGGMDVPDAKRLRELDSENAQLKKLFAETMPCGSWRGGNHEPAGAARSRRVHAGEHIDIRTPCVRLVGPFANGGAGFLVPRTMALSSA